MCGICGYITFNQNIESKKGIIRKMCDLMYHRGPDEYGYYWGANVALGHRRLSIIDLAEGQQPMCNEDESIWIVFNGEIYNFPEIKKELQQKGFSFRTNSDTEVIIHGYTAYGIDILEKLNGMFVFAIYDKNQDKIFVARDRLGKKPFYYFKDNERFIFASELKAIIADPEVPRTISDKAVDAFFSFTYIPAPLTIFQNIYKLRPGHFLILASGELAVKQYWDVKYQFPEKPLSEEDYIDELQFLLRASIKRRLLSDVPLGAFLSGGIDSSTVVALMSEICNEPVKTFSIGFNERAYSELDDAALVAKRFKTDHREEIITPNAIEVLPEIVWQTSEPFGDSSAVPTYFVSQYARQKVTVILSGDGGDELFAGYDSYLQRNRYASFKTLPRILRERIIGPAADALPISARGKFFLKELSLLERRENNELVEIYPAIKHNLFSQDLLTRLRGQESPAVILDYWKNRPTNNRLSTLQYLDTKVYMPEDILTKVDRMSMSHSLETRAPLLDYNIVEFAATIPPSLQMKDGKGKYILRKLANRFLPAQILDKKKQGFAIPRDVWFRGELTKYAADLLKSNKFTARGYFDPQTINLVLSEHIKGKRDYSTWIWCLIIFELWHQLFMDNDSRRV